MKHTIGCTTRPYGSLTFPEACDHIAAAGYADVAVFANAGQVPSALIARMRRLQKPAKPPPLLDWPFHANRQYEVESWLGSRRR